MTKQDIIDAISTNTGVEKSATRMVIDEAITVIHENLVKGNIIYLRGLFTLAPVKRAKKKAQYISKRKTIVLPERYVPKAKFSKSLVEEMKKLPVSKK